MVNVPHRATLKLSIDGVNGAKSGNNKSKPLIISSHKSIVKSKILSESKYELKNEKKRRRWKTDGWIKLQKNKSRANAAANII